MPRSFAGLILLLVFGSFGWADDLTVGFAHRDVTPKLGQEPTYLAGFGQNRPATKVHDPLFVRVLVLSDGTKKIALASVDVVGLFLPTVEAVRKRLPGFDYVLVAATHNHEAPDTLGLWGRSPFQSGVDPAFLKQIEDGIVAAVAEADRNRIPCTAAIGTVRVPELLVDNRLPEVKADELVALQFSDPTSKKPIGLLIQWNCHPETLGSGNTEISADFVAATVAHLEKQHRCPVAYLTGAVGGLMTSLKLDVVDEAGSHLPDGTFAKTKRYGKLVGQAADRALQTAKPITITPFRVNIQSVLVPVQNPLYRLAWQLGTLKRPIFEWHDDSTPESPIETQDATKPMAIRTEVGQLRLGELEFAVVPGELYPELLHGQIQNPPDPGADFPDAAIEPALFPEGPKRHRIVIGLGNDEIGYLIPKRQWDEKPPFCYGRKSPQYGETNSVGPDAAAIICGAYRKLSESQ